MLFSDFLFGEYGVFTPGISKCQKALAFVVKEAKYILASGIFLIEKELIKEITKAKD